MIKIINVHEFAKGIDTAIEYIHGIWGSSKSFAYYQDAIRHSYTSSQLLSHAVQQASAAGFSAAYLTTDHDGYYEKYGWQRIEDGIDLFTGQPSRIYKMNL